MHTSAIFLLVWAVQSAPAVDWPPEPDFITPVDYAAWFEKRVRRGEPQSQNAAAFYREILGEPLPIAKRTIDRSDKRYYGGPGWEESDGPRPWPLAERPEWKAAYEARAPLIERYKREAAKKFIDFSATNRNSKLSTRFPHLIDQTTWQHLLWCWATAASDHAWVAEDGHPDMEQFTLILEANLGLARQIERFPAPLAVMCAGKIHQTVCKDVLSVLDRQLVSEAARRRIVTTLRQVAEPPSCAESARFELAECFAVMQEDAWPDSIHWSPWKVTAPVPAVDEETRQRFGTACAELRDFFRSFAQQDVKYWTPDVSSKLAELGQRVKRTGSDFDIEDYAKSVASRLNLAFRYLTDQRATRLVIEIFCFRDALGRFPTTLDELKLVPNESKVDPFGGKPFVYVRTGDSFRLYSAGLNCRDDGGVHDSSWGKKKSDSDYVIWPVQR